VEYEWAANKAVLNSVHKKKKLKNIPFFNLQQSDEQQNREKLGFTRPTEEVKEFFVRIKKYRVHSS
jgi:hypothetical protein